jgi:hypothetical protein
MMSASKILVQVCLSAAALAVNIVPVLADNSTDLSKSPLPLSADEIASKRKAVRDELMVPSLAGIRGIAYRVVGFKDFQPLEKVMANKLSQLSITKIPLMKAEGNYKDCDAVVQITFSKLGSHTIAELKVTQFASLLRNPKIVVRAVTYSDKVYSMGYKPEESVDRLCNQFVIDFLKANQKTFDAGKGRTVSTEKKEPAPQDKKGKNK